MAQGKPAATRSRGGSPRVARFFQRIGVASFMLLSLALFSECATRAVDGAISGAPFLAADRDSELYTEHPFLYRVPRPGARYAGYRVSDHGFRGPDFAVPKPDGVYRVLTLGGSAAWDPNVTSEKHMWSARLQEKLAARLSRAGNARRPEVVNGGVPGYTSAESLMNFVWRGLPIAPDLVVIYQGYNDFKPNRHPGFRPDYSHWRSLDHSPLRRMSRHSRALHHLAKLGGRFQGRPEKTFDTVAQPGIDAFSDNLERIVLLARARAVHVVLSTYGMSVTEETLRDHPEVERKLARYLPHLSARGVLDAHRRYNAAVVALGRRLAVPVADVASAVPSDLEHFTDHCHFSDRGAEVAAGVLAETIARAMLAPPQLAAPSPPLTDGRR